MTSIRKNSSTLSAAGDWEGVDKFLPGRHRDTGKGDHSTVRTASAQEKILRSGSQKLVVQSDSSRS